MIDKHVCPSCGRAHRSPGKLCPHCSAKDERRGRAIAAAADVMAAKKARREEARREGAPVYHWRSR